MSDNPRAMLVNLGCAKNTVDTECALGELAESGFDLAIEPEDADIILINTCGFIEEARVEAYDVIREMLSFKKGNTPKVVAMGCLAQRYGAALRKEFPDLDGVLGLAAYGKLGKFATSILRDKKIVDGQSKKRQIAEGARLMTTPPSFTYLRIADGCDNRCSYCAIPLIRGRVKSREIDSILDEAANFDEVGINEQVVIAQDITLYGADLYEKPMLDELLVRLLKATKDTKFRLMYAHPAHITEETLRMIGSEERIISYLDLPLQHINSQILKDMNRHYDRARVEHILELKEKYCPDTVMRTSLITGFPGETEDQFAELLDFIKAGHFNYMGAFPYSLEEDTLAAKMKDQIPLEVAHARQEALMQAQQEVTFAWLDTRIGSKLPVVIDGEDSAGCLVCRSYAEAPEVDGVIYIENDNLQEGKKYFPGEEIIACLKSRNGYDIEATLS